MTCQASATTRTAATSDTLFDTASYAILSESFLRNRKIIGGRAFLVLLALLKFRNAGTGLAWPAIQTIADLLGIDDRGVQRGLARLIELGIIEWTGRTTLHGVRIYLVYLAMPGASSPGIINSRVVDTAFVTTGGVVSRATGGVVSHATQNIENEQTKEQQPPTPVQLDGRTNVVVVSLPSAETAKVTAAITQEPPQATIPTKAPISQPIPPTANRERFRPTVGIVNGITVQAKPLPPKTEPAHPPAFHHSLTRSEAATIMVLMAVLPQDVQAIVMDELIAQLDGGNVRRPVGYAKRLIEVAQAGAFVPSASREVAQRAEVEQANAEAERAKAAAEQAKQEQSAADAAKLDKYLEGMPPERLADVRKSFIEGLPKFTRQLFEKTGFDSPGFCVMFREHLREMLNHNPLESFK